MGRRRVPGRGLQIVRIGAVLASSLALANCGQGKVDPKYGVSASKRVVEPGEPVPKGGGTYRVGKPYQVAGRTYVPEENTNYDAEGMASWYGDAFHGRLTANGEVFDMNSVTAAHPTLPIPSYVRVTNIKNNRSVIVRVNDRGPYHENRVIDVSVRAAKLLDFHRYGVTRVRVEYVGRAALEGSDDDKLAATLRDGTRGPATVFASASQRAQEQPLRTARRGPGPDAETVVRAGPAPAYSVASERSQPATAPRLAVAEPSSSFEARFGPAASASALPAGSEPMSAFAPRLDGVMTGRGIY